MYDTYSDPCCGHFPIDVSRRAEFVIRGKNQKVELFVGSIAPTEMLSASANPLYRVHNSGPGDIKVAIASGAVTTPPGGSPIDKSFYLYAGCTVDIPSSRAVKSVVLSTEAKPAQGDPPDGTNGVEQASGWYEIMLPGAFLKKS